MYFPTGSSHFEKNSSQRQACSTIQLVAIISKRSAPARGGVSARLSCRCRTMHEYVFVIVRRGNEFKASARPCWSQCQNVPLYFSSGVFVLSQKRGLSKGQRPSHTPRRWTVTGNDLENRPHSQTLDSYWQRSVHISQKLTGLC